MGNLDEIMKLFAKRKDVYPLKAVDYGNYAFGEFKDANGNALEVKFIPGVYKEEKIKRPDCSRSE